MFKVLFMVISFPYAEFIYFELPGNIYSRAPPLEFNRNIKMNKNVDKSVYLQMIYGLRDAPAVTLQSCLTLLQGDTVYCSLDLSITPWRIKVIRNMTGPERCLHF